MGNLIDQEAWRQYMNTNLELIQEAYVSKNAVALEVLIALAKMKLDKLQETLGAHYDSSSNDT